jgi:hypothetical protein
MEMEPLKPEIVEKLNKADLDEYQRLLAERFTTQVTDPAREKRIGELFQKLFGSH